MLRSHSSPSPLTQTHTYIQKLTHFPPTCMQIPPQYTQAHCEATKQKTTSCSKNTQGTLNSLLNQSNRCASRRTRSLSRALKAHLDATNMFYDKMNEEEKLCAQRAVHRIALKGQASKCRYRITRIDASVFPL